MSINVEAYGHILTVLNIKLLDTTNGETLASKALQSLKKNEKEIVLLDLWKKILEQAKDTDGYTPTYNYGLYQIKTELNTEHIDTETGESVPDYPELNGNIETLGNLVKDYYIEEIVPILLSLLQEGRNADK